MQMKNPISNYKGKDIDVIFHVMRCTHVSACVDNLHAVFDTSRRPWIIPDNASADKVADVCLLCPTGALHFNRKDGGYEEKIPSTNTIIVGKHGPLYFNGNISLETPTGEVLLQDTRMALCRCGLSKNMPICDESHEKLDFRDGAIHYHTHPYNLPLSSGVLHVIFQPLGTYILKGPFTLQSSEGSILFTGERGALCSCGKTKDQPWCDGNHLKKDASNG